MAELNTRNDIQGLLRIAAMLSVKTQFSGGGKLLKDPQVLMDDITQAL